MQTDLDILVILDRSGSMQDAKSDHEGGLKSFVEDQRQLEGDVRFTLVQFDSNNPCEIIYDRTPLADVKEIELIPRGGTPLLDAIGRATSHLRAKIAKDTKVVAMVITDGEENSSHEWTKERVKALVTELEAAGWTFLYLGANVDAFDEAAKYGVAAAGAMNYKMTPQSVNRAYAATSGNMMRARSAMRAGMSGQSVSSYLNYTDEQRAAVDGLDEDSTAPKGAVTHGVVSGSGSVVADSQTKER